MKIFYAHRYIVKKGYFRTSDRMSGVPLGSMDHALKSLDLMYVIQL